MTKSNDKMEVKEYFNGDWYFSEYINRFHEKTIVRMCPTCHNTLYENFYEGDKKYWRDKRLVLLCCKCLTFINQVKDNELYISEIEPHSNDDIIYFSSFDDNKTYYRSFIMVEGTLKRMIQFGLIDGAKWNSKEVVCVE